MNYQEMKEDALINALANYICNLDELQDEGKTAVEILTMMEKNDKEIIVWEPFEDWEISSVANEVFNTYLSNIRNNEFLLKSVMGDEAYEAWKEGK